MHFLINFKLFVLQNHFKLIVYQFAIFSLLVWPRNSHAKKQMSLFISRGLVSWWHPLSWFDLWNLQASVKKQWHTSSQICYEHFNDKNSHGSLENQDVNVLNFLQILSVHSLIYTEYWIIPTSCIAIKRDMRSTTKGNFLIKWPTHYDIICKQEVATKSKTCRPCIVLLQWC